jgi:TusA-related sulfurtransferase
LEHKADYTIDFRASISSISLLKISRIFKEMESRKIIEILGSDPDLQKDLFKVLPESSYEVILMEAVEGEGYRVQLRKRH